MRDVPASGILSHVLPAHALPPHRLERLLRGSLGESMLRMEERRVLEREAHRGAVLAALAHGDPSAAEETRALAEETSEERTHAEQIDVLRVGGRAEEALGAGEEKALPLEEAGSRAGRLGRNLLLGRVEGFKELQVKRGGGGEVRGGWG